MAAGICIPTFPADLDRDHFGHWLSGFCDGESTFALRVIRYSRNKTNQPIALFSLTLRADDYEILSRIHAYWGCGTMRRFSNERSTIKNAKPVWNYGVRDVPSLFRVLVPHFERYPLRAKKLSDFTFWKQGVALLHEVQQRPDIYRRVGNRIRGKHHKWTEDDHHRFGSLLNALRDQRAYREDLPPE